MDILDEIWKARHQYDVLFLELIDGCEIKVSSQFPNYIFYIKDDKLLIKYTSETKYAYINYLLIWSVFSIKFSLNYEETRVLMKYMLETHLKIKVTIPCASSINGFPVLEAYLKLHAITHKAIK